jgi:hypothetical protein
MTPDETATRRVEMTGWSTIALGVLCLGLAGLQAVVPILLRRLDATLDAPDDPTRAMRDAWTAGSGTGAVVNGIFGVALLFIGFGVTRRLRWAHPALEAGGRERPGRGAWDAHRGDRAGRRPDRSGPLVPEVLEEARGARGVPAPRRAYP